jgi:membrane protease YdiL (CAAX protease family)
MSVAAKVRTVVLAIAVALLILAYGQGLWGLLAFANVAVSPAVPWAGPVMALLLVGLYAFLSGRLWPGASAATRRRLLALRAVSLETFSWSLIAGVCAVVAAAGLWIVLSQITPWSPNILPNAKGVPVASLAVLLLTASLAAPLTEEAAFRGYAQGLMQRAFRPWTSLVIVSALFAAAHLTQGLFAGKLLVYFLAGLSFGAIRQLSGSLVPGIIVHMIADLTFFTLVWPADGHRTLVSAGGADLWFWIHVGQVVVFAPLAILAFRRLARVVEALHGSPLAVAATA